MRNKLFSTIAAGVALTLFGGLASSAEFLDWDSDGDSYLSNDEFYGGVADHGMFSAYDLDGNALLDDDEFGEVDLDANFDYWDADDNGWLDSGEYFDGYYDYYDNDEDGYWDDNEWDDADEDGFFDW